MENICFFLIAATGLTHLLIDGSIFSKLRSWVISFNNEWLKELVSCYQCAGFHLSFLLGLIFNPLNLPWYYSVFICAFAGSYSAMFGAAVLNYLDSPNQIKGNNG